MNLSNWCRQVEVSSGHYPGWGFFTKIVKGRKSKRCIGIGSFVSSNVCYCDGSDMLISICVCVHFYHSFRFFFLRICYYFPSLSGQYLNVNVEKVEFDFMI